MNSFVPLIENNPWVEFIGEIGDNREAGVFERRLIGLLVRSTGRSRSISSDRGAACRHAPSRHAAHRGGDRTAPAVAREPAAPIGPAQKLRLLVSPISPMNSTNGLFSISGRMSSIVIILVAADRPLPRSSAEIQQRMAILMAR